MTKHGRITEDVKREYARVMNKRKFYGDKLIEKWVREGTGVGLDKLAESNIERARNTAIAIQNQEKYLKGLQETVIATSFSTRPENLLKVVRIGVANSNRGEIFTEYPLVSTDDALFYIDMTYEQSLRGSTAAQKIYENINMYYSGEEAIATINAAGLSTAYSVTITTSVPIVPGSVRLIVGGAIKATDNGSNTLVPFVTGYLTGTNTVDYTSGAFVLNFAAAPNASIQVVYNWNSEDSNLYSQYGTVGISVIKKRFNARPMPLGYSFSEMTKIMMQTTGLGSAEDLLLGAVGDEHAKSRDYKAIARGRQIAMGNAVTTFNSDFAAEGEVSDKMHAQKLLSKIGEVGAAIYDDIKRGQVNKAVAGSKALVYMKKHDLWKDDKSQPRSGVYKAGSLSDIDVYACPADASLVANNEVLLTYKNPEQGLDLSLVFGVLTEITAQLAYPQFYTQGNFATVEDCLSINTKFTRLLSISGL
jgi:hypothetical protein